MARDGELQPFWMVAAFNIESESVNSVPHPKGIENLGLQVVQNRDCPSL